MENVAPDLMLFTTLDPLAGILVYLIYLTSGKQRHDPLPLNLGLKPHCIKVRYVDVYFSTCLRIILGPDRFRY